MIRTNDSNFGTRLRAVLLAGAFFLLATVTGFGQQQINLTVAPTTTTLPDGTQLPMWGYFCGSAVAGSTATCSALNPTSVANPAATTWSPVVITVPTGQALTINLTNNLSFATGSGTNTVPTSIVIVGQVGGGLGSARTATQSPNHSLAQGCPTWFIASPNTPPGQPCTTTVGSPGSGTPPNQANRVQSMAQEVAATGATVQTGEVASGSALTWSALRPGTYLLESGTHPSIQVPMGLIGMLVVTTPPSGATAGTAYPGAGSGAAAVPAVQYNAEVPLLFSEIDPVQNKAVATDVATAGFSETKVWSGMTGQCGNPTSPVGVVNTCYPPTVNYTPFYYLINGVALNKTNPTMSLFPATAGTAGTPPVPVTTGIPTTGTVLVRLVNAGLRMHVPSIVGSQTLGFNGAGAAAAVAGFTLIAEDGNVVPGVVAPGKTFPSAPKVQTDVFMAAGKTYDVMVNVPALPAGATATPALPIYDRELSLSGNSSERDAGMLAYISVNNNLTLNPGAGLPVAAGTGIFAAAKANNDIYDSVIPCTAAPCKPLVISDVSKGVIANDVSVYGVQLLTAPTKGTLSCTSLGTGLCANGTFTYTPNAGSNGADSFTYCANNGFVAASGATPASCSSASLTATVTLGASTLTGNPTAIAQNYTAKTATYIKIPSPGLLLGNSDPNGLALSLATSPAPTVTGGSVTVDAQGGFTLSLPSNTVATSVNFSYTVQNSQGRSATGTATVHFPAPSNLAVKVVDAQAYKNCNGDSTCIGKLTQITDYRWIIEEDKTFYVDPNCTTNSSVNTPGCPTVVGAAGQTTIPTFGVQFHTSTMEFVAQGCTGTLSCEGGQTMLDTRPACISAGVPAGCSATAGQHINAVCDLGNGACRPDTTGNGFTAVMPSSVVLNPAKRYYISVLPGDASNPFPAYTGNPGCSTTTGANPNNGTCGHTMSGAPIPAACNILGGPNACTTSSAFTQPVTVLVLPTPLPTGKLTVMVFEDDYPLNGEQDGGGGNATVAPLEPGLGGFNIALWDTYGGLGDVTGQDTYDMFNQPLANSLAGTIDPASGLDACPISKTPLTGPAGSGPAPATGMTGMIVTCPKYEADGQTLSPLAGQAVIANLMPEKFSVQAYPGADRIARGEEWIQTNTLDGQHPHDSFIRIGEPSYFQEYGPAGYHVSIGFANPAIINARHADVCAGVFGSVGACTGTVTGQVDVQRLSRTPDQRLYSSGSRDGFAWTQCWVSLGDPDAEDFMFTKCDANGNFKFTSVPGGNWRVTLGDQWNDQIIDGLSVPANVTAGQTLNLGNIGAQQWQANIYTRTFVDDNKDGIWDNNEIGIPLIYTKIRYRDGHNANSLTTDFNGIASFNETFPLFNWYVVEADSGRYKTTGIHTVYDAGGPADGSSSCGGGARPCGTSTAYNFLANTYEAVPLPADLSVPGAVYCATADCTAEAASFAAGTAIPSPGHGQTASTGRIDPPWVSSEGWSGMTSQSNWIEFGKAPYAACNPALPVSSTNFCATVTSTAPGSTTATNALVGENGGIHGFVDYASTRPFDSASWMIEQPWESYVPHVTINLYQEGFAADGVTPTLKMVDTTQTSSWDDWAQGFYPNSSASGGQKPYMSCPGQGTAATGSANQDLFYFTLFDQPNYLDWYNHTYNGATQHTLPYGSQYKCYDAMHIWNQLQPAPYDGKYSFPSVLGIDPTSGKLLAVKGSTNGVASSMNGTNCTICVANPDTTDKYRVGTPMLPPGKYVVEVIMPPGFEVYKEEDKNLLIGDNFIAPVTQQFGGLGTDIFIIPDQASVASLYDPSGAGFNPNNYQDSTTSFGLTEELSGVPGFPGYQDPLWPCVGEQRVVPDYLSLFPTAKEVAPFAGAVRPLCDRKEITLANQMSVSAKFYIFTSTHIASKFTGVITDDFTSEFDPFAPQFGEKFSPPNLPISTRDYLGNEISRVYSDHWGIYNGLTFSSWEVNPPNITGYSPTMMVQCMNDPGPIVDTRSQIPNPAGAGFIANPTYGQMITDPLYNPAYSDFCYEEPYMPGLTTYLDTPVVPTQAFVGAGYNNPDCSYPDATPAIKEVDGDGVGPWVAAANHTLTITALGDVQVPNADYSGPSANVPPFNLKTVKRHYGFGSPGTVVLLGSDGVSHPLTGVSWSDSQITGTVPSGLPNCSVQQQAQYGGSTAQCGQLVITSGNGNASVDTVTVTIGGKQPKHIAATASIQGAIDAAAPGDLLIIDPTCTTGAGTATTIVSCTTAGATKAVGSHNELLIMWKPVRLQGVGAATSIVNANTQPAGQLLDPWRRHINCLFGLTLQGVPYGNTSPYDSPTDTANNGGPYTCPDPSWQYFSGAGQTVTGGTVTTGSSPQIDRLPLESTVGWDATLNGNLAEQLQEPSLMGAFEGAAITVLAKGLDFHGADPWSDGTEVGAFPAGATLLTGVGPNPVALPTGDANKFCTDGSGGANRYPSNFMCNPSSIDGLSLINSSQGGGGIFAHGWAHHLQIANNRVYNNAGTLTGGISVGQGEFPTPYVQGSTTNAAPGSCSDGTGVAINQHLPYCLQLAVNVHHNFITNNSSLGDELFSGTLSGSGGVTFCTGNDYYKFNYNWVCGNLSSGEGGGLVHLGEIQQGDIEHNAILFNQSDNPTIPTNGGGIQVMGTPDTDPTCGTQSDADCPPGLSDGTGLGLTINANLIQGNMAESGAGGGIRLQQVNGTEVSTFPANPGRWNGVSITNNIIANNVAGWDGAGISLQDSLNVQIVNNTIVSNDSLASSGVLTQTVGYPVASAPAGNGVCAVGGLQTSCPQSAGVTSTQNSPLLLTSLSGLTLTCPGGQPDSSCHGFSNPLLQNNVIWQNRSFYVGVGNLGQGTMNQQKLVSLFDAFTHAPAPVQAAAGACTAGLGNYWEIGVRGDSGPTNHGSGFTLNPTYSVMSNTSGYSGTNSSTTPPLVRQYCNGSRVPPECTVANGCGGPSGYGVPPGIADATAPNPVFSLTPSATVDEGNNWINVSWGPLALNNPFVTSGAGSTGTGNYGSGPSFGNYGLSAAIDNVPVSQPHPPLDFFGNPRPETGGDGLFDPGAVEFAAGGGGGGGGGTPGAHLAPPAHNFGNVTRGSSRTFVFTLTNNGTATLTNIVSPTITANGTNFSIVPLLTTCGTVGLLQQTSLAPGAACAIAVRFNPPASDVFNSIQAGMLSITDAVGTQTANLTGRAR
jgi:Bacterial Ig domain